MRKIMYSLLMVPILLISFTSPANAQTFTYYPTGTEQEKINYLYSVVAQLQAQLAGLLQQNNSNVSNNSYYNNSNNYYSGNTSSYLNGVNSLDVTVRNYNSASLQGSVNFRTNNDAKVWFEYGPNSFMSYSTPILSLNGSSNNTRNYSIIAPDLNNNTTYYYRAVAEDSRGNVIVGQTKTFTLNSNNYSYNNGYYNNNDYYNISHSSNYNNNDDDWSLDVDDNEYDTGDSIRVEYTIPDDEEDSNNWIGLYKTGDDDEDYVSRQYVSRNNGTVTFKVYDDEDEYELRLFSNNSYRNEAVSDEFEVND